MTLCYIFIISMVSTLPIYKVMAEVPINMLQIEFRNDAEKNSDWNAVPSIIAGCRLFSYLLYVLIPMKLRFLENECPLQVSLWFAGLGFSVETILPY